MGYVFGCFCICRVFCYSMASGNRVNCKPCLLQREIFWPGVLYVRFGKEFYTVRRW